MSKVLVIAPHPDDEAIGCGGTIFQHVRNGDEVLVLLLTSGELGCPGEDPEVVSLTRVHEAMEASKILGSRVLDYWSYPDGNLQVSGEIINRLAKLLAEHKPDILYVTSPLDGHIDHRAAAQIVDACLEKATFIPECWFYEVWSPLVTYDRAVDITENLGIKLLAIRKHESQVKRIRFDEAALALARFRGELHNRPHGPYAEVFMKR